jgi:DNA-3-methyladenine glycosylase II
MQLALPTTQPFSFTQTLAFIRRFPPCQGDYLVTDDSLTAAVSVGGAAHAFTIVAGTAVEIDDATPPAVAAELALRASQLVGATDDVAAFYAAADGDAPMQQLVRLLHGLHHVRFLTLAEIAVYSVLMQRTPVAVAAALKRRFVAAFGTPIVVRGHTLRAWPSLDAAAALSADELARVLRHRAKAERIVEVVRGVRALGESFLRDAPYGDAKAALLAIPGVGPFSAGAILLRGLGRMDELPWSERFASIARELYGRRVSADAIADRYGRHVGYWSFYLMTGTPRLREAADGGGSSACGFRGPRDVRCGLESPTLPHGFAICVSNEAPGLGPRGERNRLRDRPRRGRDTRYRVVR